MADSQPYSKRLEERQMVSFDELADRFPSMTYGDLCDLLYMFGVKVKLRLVPLERCPFLEEAWIRLASEEAKGD